MILEVNKCFLQVFKISNFILTYKLLPLLGWPRVKILAMSVHEILPLILLVLNSFMLPIISSFVIYLKLICIKRRLFLNKVGVIQSEGATTIAQQSEINVRQETQFELENDFKLQSSSSCSKYKEGIHEKNCLPCPGVCEAQDEEMSQKNNLSENKTKLKNLENCTPSKNYKTCDPTQTQNNHQISSSRTVLMESEDIQVISEEQVDNTLSNSDELCTTSIQTYNNTDLEMGTISRDILPSGNLLEDTLSKDILSLENLPTKTISEDNLANDILLKDSLPRNNISKVSLSRDILLKDTFSEDILSKQEEEKTKAQLAAASRSMKTNLTLGLIFILLLSTLLLVPEFWRPYLNAITFTLSKGLMPILTAIANFGTVKFVALQYLEYVQNAWNLALSKITPNY